MAKTSGELEKEFIDNLGATSGRDLAGWLKFLAGAGLGKRNDMLNYLKQEQGFGHMNASLLAGIFFNEGKPVYASQNTLLDDQFKGKELLRPLYEQLIDFIGGHFPGAEVVVKKTYVSITGKREFAAVNIKSSELRLGLDLGEQPFDDYLQKSKLSGPMPRISHMVSITDTAELDTRLLAAMRVSYLRVHP